MSSLVYLEEATVSEAGFDGFSGVAETIDADI